MTIQECVQFMANNGYIIRQKDRFLLTSKFNLEVLGLDIGVKVVKREEITVKEEKKVVDWVVEFQNFIMEARVPKYSTNSKGDPYEVSRATKPGREAFKKAVESGVSREQLLRAVNQYYREGRGRYRVKIETYFVDEHWRGAAGEENSNSRTHDGNTITLPNI